MSRAEARSLPKINTRSCWLLAATLFLAPRLVHAQPLPPYDGPRFVPAPETQLVIDSLQGRFGTHTILPSTWDLGRERYPLSPASPEVIRTIESAYEHIRPLVSQLPHLQGADGTLPSSYPGELRIYTLRGLAGSPGGGYADNMIQLTIPGSIDLHALAPIDKDGIRREGTVEDEIAHAAMHEVMHRFTVLNPALYEEYVARFWRHNKDGTWTIKDRRNLSGYRGEPTPWEIYADELASVSIPIRDDFDVRLSGSPYGYRAMSPGMLILLKGHPELRSWAMDRKRSDIFSSLPHIYLPKTSR